MARAPHVASAGRGVRLCRAGLLSQVSLRFESRLHTACESIKLSSSRLRLRPDLQRSRAPLHLLDTASLPLPPWARRRLPLWTYRALVSPEPCQSPHSGRALSSARVQSGELPRLLQVLIALWCRFRGGSIRPFSPFLSRRVVCGGERPRARADLRADPRAVQVLFSFGDVSKPP